MAGTLIFLLSSSLLQGALCGTFNIKMPKMINVLRGSCVTIPCSFDVESKFENNLDDTCKAYWSDSTSFTTENGKLNPTKEMTGDLAKKDCTTTFDNANLLQRSTYYFRLECENALKYTFTQAVVDISFIDHPPSPTLTPSKLEVKEGTSVSVTCSAPAPCWSHPPALTWTPNLGQSQETLQENQDKTKVKTSVVSFTASHLHHGNKISCTAVYRKQHGSPDVTAETSLTPVVSYSPKDVNISVSPYGPVVENREVTLTCSSNANPAVENYTWYRADGDKETFMGTGRTLNVAVSTINSIFFCKATNTLGFERSSNLEIDVQFPPKNIRISVSPYGPVVENREVTLTCSSNANPAVENYTWYRADGDKETFMGTGRTLNVAVSTINSIFFCKATNTLGFERSSNLEIDVQYSPKKVTLSVSPSGPVPENNNVTLTCSSNANPTVRNYTWYRADGDQETFIGTGTSLNIEVSRDRWTFFCTAENEIGVGRSSSMQVDVQYSVLYPVIISALTALLLVPICVVLFSIRAQMNPCKPKGQLPDESNTAATTQPITMKENEAPNTLEDSIYANTDWLKVPENIHLATITGPSNTNLPNFKANNEEGESENSEEEDSCDAIYSNVNWKTKSKKKA